MPDGAVHEEIVGEAQTPSVAETTKTPEKEGAATPSKGRTSSTSSRGKAKATTSTSASSPAGTEAGTPEREEEEEVIFDEHGDIGEDEMEMKEAEQEEAEKEEESEEEEDEPPAKRVKTSARRVKEEPVEITAPEGMGERGIVAPKVLDFDAFAELGVAEEVREKFNNIGWGKFLDLDMTSYTELVRELFTNLKVTSRGEEGVVHIEFTFDKKRERLNPNQINCDLEVTELDYMITDEFKKVVKMIPLMSKDEMNKKWALIGRKEEFSERAREASLKTPALRVCHRILALNFFGKRDSGNTVSANELYILWAMETKA